VKLHADQMRTKQRTSRSDQTELPFENPPEQGTGQAKRSQSRLGESNPGPTHYEIYPAVDGCLRLLRTPVANKGNMLPKADGC
jgi:hypothetical protein